MTFPRPDIAAIRDREQYLLDKNISQTKKAITNYIPNMKHKLNSVRTLSVTMITFVSLTAAANADTVVVPNELATTDGNGSFFSAPFNSSLPSREMVIYDAAQFARLTDPFVITGVTLRPSGSQASGFSRSFSSVRIFLSTTSQTIAGLSPTFADNIGSNNTLVRSGNLTIASSNLPGPGSTKLFDISIPFTTPFLYNPAAGNLLLDIQNFDSGRTGLINGNSYASGTGPTASLFFDGSATNPTGTVQSGGLVAQFTVQTLPELELRAVGQTLVIEFSGLLQESDDLIKWRTIEPQPVSPYSTTITDNKKFWRAAGF